MMPGWGLNYCDRHWGPGFTSQLYCLLQEMCKSRWIKVNTFWSQDRDIKCTAGPDTRCLCDNKKDSFRPGTQTPCESALLMASLHGEAFEKSVALGSTSTGRQSEEAPPLRGLLWRTMDGSALLQTWSYGSTLRQASQGFPGSGLWART